MLNNEFNFFKIILLNNVITSITRFKINYIKVYITLFYYPQSR